ncbi:MAG: hypothetical protein R2762_14500 [Bryobacteraceae bacterium]
MSLALLLPVLALGQGFGGIFDKASPDVEQALRARVDHFYLSLKESKYRKADEVVHESAKDVFFGAEKFSFRDFKVVSVTWEDNYTKARVVVDMDSDFFFPGFGKIAVHRPLTSFWMSDAGQWWWYVPKFDTRESPFGAMSPGPDAAKSAKPEDVWRDNAVTPDQIRNTVRADKGEVTLSSHEVSHAEVNIKSVFAGPVKLRLDAIDYPGITVNLDKAELKTGETAKLTFDFKPWSRAKKSDFRAQIHVDPIGSIIPIEVHFSYPPQ